MRLVFDIETDGLLDVMTRIHCIVAADIDTGEFHEFPPTAIDAGIAFLQQASELVAHNGFWFDYEAIRRLYPQSPLSATLRDSLAEARLVYSNIADIDFSRQRRRLGNLPPKLLGSHSLKAWGYRLGVLKGDFGETTDWKRYSPEMLHYCRQDVLVTLSLVRRIEEKRYSPVALWMENRISALVARQEFNGFCFDETAAATLYAALVQRRDELREALVAAFGWWNQPLEVKVPPRSIRYKDPLQADPTEGAPYTRFLQVRFNPGSRQHIAKRLKELYGWEPDVFTESGQPQIDETVLSRMDNPHAKLLAESFLIDKRIAQLAEGNNAWLRLCRHGRLHGRVNPNGAVTGRATHSNPNLAQVPSARAEYGPQCRELFGVPSGWSLLGSDASGLELRCLGHFMARYDEGAYIRILLEGDIHWANVLALGLLPPGTERNKHDPRHEWARSVAKTFIYAFLYGAGSEKIGSIVMPDAGPDEQKREGKRLRARFLKSFPALKMLIEAVKKAAAKGWLSGLDGRRVYVRSQHAALNTLLQSAGALICKRWLIELEDLCKAQGLVHGWHGDYAFCAWVHDEVQIACRNAAVARQIGGLCQEAMTLTEKAFSFRCQLASDHAIGTTWADTH